MYGLDCAVLLVTICSQPSFLGTKGIKRVHFRTVWASFLARALCVRRAHKIFVRVWFLFKGSASHAMGWVTTAECLRTWEIHADSCIHSSNCFWACCVQAYTLTPPASSRSLDQAHSHTSNSNSPDKSNLIPTCSGTWFSGGLLVRAVWLGHGWTRWSLRSFPTWVILWFYSMILSSLLLLAGLWSQHGLHLASLPIHSFGFAPFLVLFPFLLLSGLSFSCVQAASLRSAPSRGSPKSWQVRYSLVTHLIVDFSRLFVPLKDDCSSVLPHFLWIWIGSPAALEWVDSSLLLLLRKLNSEVGPNFSDVRQITTTSHCVLKPIDCQQQLTTTCFWYLGKCRGIQVSLDSGDAGDPKIHVNCSSGRV